MGNFAKSVEARTKGLKRDLKYVAVMSIQDVVEAAQTPQLAITAGAHSFVVGKIPVDTSQLINSLTSEGNEGPDSYSVALSNYRIGDYMQFAWTAPYAARIEYGYTGTDSLGRYYNVAGRYFVGANAAKFPEFVKKRVAETK